MFNYYKPGKGVSENEPEKNIFALYFSVLWRKFRRFVGINLLYIVCSIPFVAAALLIAIPFCVNMGFSWDHLSRYLCMIMMYLVFIGIAPISIGAAAVFKKYSRQQHAWVVSEFFAAIKENIGVTLRLFLIDIVFTVILLADLYFMNAFQGMQYVIVSLTTYFMIFLFISAHFYVYQIILMFDVGAVAALKNAVIIAVAKLPQSLLLFVMILLAGTVLNSTLLFLLLGYAPLSFAINLYAERFLTKKYITDDKEE